MHALFRHAIMKHLIVAGLTLCLLLAIGPSEVFAASSAQEYEEVRRTYFAFKSDPKKKKFRHDWIQVIARFQGFLAAYPDAEQACRAGYTEAELWRGLHNVSRVNSDLRRALGAYEIAEVLCHGTSLADDALWQQVVISARRKSHQSEASLLAERLVQQFPVSDMAPRAKKWLKERGVALKPLGAESQKATALSKGRLLGRSDSESPSKASVKNIKTWSNDEYVRVVIYMSQPTEFRIGSIVGKTAGNTKGRIFVDLPTSDSELKSKTIDTAVVRRVRLAKREKGALRVVLDLGQASADYTTLVLENPFRIIVDVAAATVPVEQKTPVYKPRFQKTLVVIDPGHGGKDTGATGRRGLKEKDVALRISKELKRVLEGAGLSATLTRDTDKFVPLEERTALANRLNADIFVSIHANAHDDARVHGVETYYLDTTNDKYALRLAAVENKVREERVSEVQMALAQVSSRLHTRDSKRIASNITDALSRVAKKSTGRTRNLGAKPSLFYVLLGARMPAVLVEASFVTNVKDAKMLSSQKGARALGKAMGEAVLDYLRESKTLGQR